MGLFDFLKGPKYLFNVAISREEKPTPPENQEADATRISPESKLAVKIMTFGEDGTIIPGGKKGLPTYPATIENSEGSLFLRVDIEKNIEAGISLRNGEQPRERYEVASDGTNYYAVLKSSQSST